jgi:heme-degrading monooxygenase HmoA
MRRRTLLKSAIASAGVAAAAPAATSGRRPIQLHTDLHVKLEEEQQLIDDFHKLYLPRIRKAPGFIDAKLVKFVKANIGTAPEHYNYRLIQVFETEEQRHAWTLMEDHKIGWHKAIESHVKVPFIAYLYEIAAEAKPTR